MDPFVNKLRALIGAEPPIRILDDKGALELLSFIDADLFGEASKGTREAFFLRERQVCKAVRSGRLLLDYVPMSGDAVRLPARDHPLFAQALVYWAATLEEPIMQLAEACLLAGEGASPKRVKAAARRVAFEAQTMQTDRIYLPGFDRKD